MARIYEDESAGLVKKSLPNVGERWLHAEGYTVVIEWFHVVGDVVRKGELYNFYGVDALAKSDIEGMSQCVTYTGFDNSAVYIRTVSNFLERFERIA